MICKPRKGLAAKQAKKRPIEINAVTDEKQNRKAPAVTLDPEQRPLALRAMSLALALTDMLPPNAVPSLFRYDLEQLAETIATQR